MIRAAAIACALLLLAGCGSDYRSPAFETTGAPPSLLGQVVDVEVFLPNLLIDAAIQRGVSLELRIEASRDGSGRIEARVEPLDAFWDMTGAPIEDLSDGRTALTIGGGSWVSERIGPWRIGNTSFEIALNGTTGDGGWTAAGQAWESQTGLPGNFEAWRRQRFLVACSDFSGPGRLALVSWVKRRELRVRDRLEFVSSDPFLRRSGGSLFAVNRLSFDNLQRLDPDSDFRTVWQAGIGLGANPHDVLLLDSERAYVTRYEPPFDDVAVISPRGGTFLRSIDLGGLGDNGDGIARPDRIVAAGDALFVGLQSIGAAFDEYGEGKLAVIDPATDALAGEIPLIGKNPGEIRVHTGADGRERLYVALAGIFPGLLPQELSGGVAVVDVVNRAVERFALDDDDAGGNVGALALIHDELGYVAVTDDAYVTRVLAFDPQSATLRRTVWQTSEFVPELESGGSGVLAVPDRGFAAPRLCLYLPSSDPALPELPLGCAPLQVAPLSIEALD